MEKKIETKLHELCKGFPEEFASYLQYCRNLKFDQEPDYDYLKANFSNSLASLNYENDFIYDWSGLFKKSK